MKALTICQPFAHLIMSGDKRVENRTWATNYRGPLYIHAGKSRSWLDVDEGVDSSGFKVADMAFGAVIGIVDLVDCLRCDHIMAGNHDRNYPWIREHEHTEGPWCWVLERPVSIGPWPWKGQLGLFEIDSDALGAVANTILGVKA